MKSVDKGQNEALTEEKSQKIIMSSRLPAFIKVNFHSQEKSNGYGFSIPIAPAIYAPTMHMLGSGLVSLIKLKVNSLFFINFYHLVAKIKKGS